MKHTIDRMNDRSKILFVMYNLVLWSTGLVLLWFGVWLEVEFSRYMLLDWQAVSYFLIATGAAIVLFNSISCFCALKSGESSSLLNLYGLVLGVVFVVELMLSVSMVWLKQQLMSKFNVDNVKVQRENGVINLDLIQSALHCCGLTGSADWNTSFQASAVPSSCCLAHIPKCNTSHVANLWPQGCSGQMENFIDQNIGVMCLLVLGFAAVTLLGVFCSFSWARKYSSTYEVIGDD